MLADVAAMFSYVDFKIISTADLMLFNLWWYFKVVAVRAIADVTLALLHIFSSAGETFRVFILLPLLPAFEGEIGSATGNALRTILHYQ